MARHRTRSIEFKRQVAQEFLAGDTLHGLAKRHDICRNLNPGLGPEVFGIAAALMRTPQPQIFSSSMKPGSHRSSSLSASRRWSLSF